MQIGVRQSQRPVASNTAPTPAGTSEHPVANWPADRNYVMHVPDTYDPSQPTPVMVVFHGYSHDAKVMEAMTSPDGKSSHPDSLNSLANREGFVVVYPNGTPLGAFRKGRGWNGGGGVNGFAAVSSPAVEKNYNDVGFLNDVLNDVEKKINVDKSRVYGAGISNGGALAFKVAAQMSDRFAAIASVAAGDQFALASKAGEPAVDMPVVLIHGEKDPIWPFQGGLSNYGKFVSVPETAETWANWNEAQKVSTEMLPDLDPNDGTRVTKTVYKGETPQSDLEFYSVQGGGHAWPGGQQFSPESSIGKVSRDFKANEVIWNFFKEHSKA